MQALVYRRSVVRYLLGGLASRLWPRRFFPRLAPCRLEEVPPPQPPPGWVLLKTRLCGICGSDINLLKGVESLLLEPYASFPAILGHEILAEVVAAPAASGWQAGERVAVEPVLPCLLRDLPPCPACARGDYNLCENFTRGSLSPGVGIGFSASVGGGMADYLFAHPSQLFRVPDGIPDDLAVLTDSLASALHPALHNFPAPPDTVVVFGAGILGQHLVRILRALGFPGRLIAVARYPFQKDLALAGGADACLLSPARGELGEAVGAELLPTTLGGGNLEGGADLFFDCVGSRTSFQEGLLALRAQGRFVLVGTAGRVSGVDISSIWFRELVVTGSSLYGWENFEGRRVRTFALALELLARPDFPAQGLLTHVFPLSQYARAFQTAFHKAARQVVKVALDPRPPAP